MAFPAELKYTETHEWVKIENGTALVGITDFAQGELGDVVYIDIPEKKAVAIGENFGSIEAVKTVSDLVAPVTGTITDINPELDGSPELVNTDPYGKGWMIKMTVEKPEELATLLDAAKYASLIGK